MAKTPIFLVGFLLLNCWVAMSEAEYLKYKDPKQPLNIRIKDLISRMTLEEKIGQMVQIDRSVASADVINKYFIGKISPLAVVRFNHFLFLFLFLFLFFFIW